MTKEELKKKYAVLDGWIKQHIGGKAFLFVSGVYKARQKRRYCIARTYYGSAVCISDWMTLEQLEMFLLGVIHARDIKADARGVKRQSYTLYGMGANVPGLVEKGRLISE